MEDNSNTESFSFHRVLIQVLDYSEKLENSPMKVKYISRNQRFTSPENISDPIFDPTNQSGRTTRTERYST